MKAHTLLKAEGIHIRVVDIFSIKPIDKAGLLKNAKETGNRILVVEDHYKEGGIHEAVCSALSEDGIKVSGLAVGEVPRSGMPDELLAKYQINMTAIVAKVKKMIS
jgi:transketolase